MTQAGKINLFYYSDEPFRPICKDWWDRVCRKSSRQRYADKKIIVEVVGITVPVIFLDNVSIRNVVKIVKESFAYPRFKGQVHLGVQDVFKPAPKRDGRLNVAVCLRLALVPRNAK